MSQGGTRSFRVQHGADRQFITIGRYPIISLADARDQAKHILAERTLGKHRPQSIAPHDAPPIFLAACEKKNRPCTVRDYTRLLTRHFPFNREHLTDIAPQAHRAQARPPHRHSRRAEPRACRCEKFSLPVDTCAALCRAISAAEGMQIAKRPSRDRVLTDQELAAVYAAALSGDDSFSHIVALLVLTGQRCTEIGSLRWEWINEKDQTITLPASFTQIQAHSRPLRIDGRRDPGAYPTYGTRFPGEPAERARQTP